MHEILTAYTPAGLALHCGGGGADRTYVHARARRFRNGHSLHPVAGEPRGTGVCCVCVVCVCVRVLVRV